MHIEADLLRVRRPMLIAETVREFAVLRRIEGVITRADGGLVDLVVASGLLYLL